MGTIKTFFSTDVVKYQDGSGGLGTFSPIAMERWLEVTLPLTAITLLAAWMTYKYANKGRREQDEVEVASTRVWSNLWRRRNPSLPQYKEKDRFD